jgi:hypothetical protein
MEGSAAPPGTAGSLNSLIEAAQASKNLSVENSTPGTGQLDSVDNAVSTQGSPDMNPDSTSFTGPDLTPDTTLDALLTSTQTEPPPDLSQKAMEVSQGSTSLTGPSAPVPATPLKSTVLTTPLKTTKPEVIDVADTPVKKKPPSRTRKMEVDAPTWFSDSLPQTGSEPSKKLLSIKSVEERIKQRFPRCQPMVPEMVEFLSQTSSPYDDIKGFTN